MTPTPTRRSPSSPRGKACLTRYEDPEKFLVLFNPTHQVAYTEDEARAITGKAPTLAAVSDAFGLATARTWLRAQLIDLAEFAGAKGKLTDQQLTLLARLMYNEHRHWPVTVYMLFFTRLKSGAYGKFFGNVDPMQITEALRRFALWKQEREYEIDLEQRLARQKAEDAAHAAAVRRHQEHLQRLGITQQQWMANMDVFMDGPRERCLPEDVERRMLTQRGVYNV